MAQKTTTVFLFGGLGNQMFQYALGLHLAKKNNAQLLLDTTFLNDRFPRKEFTYRVFDLDIFTLSSDEIKENKPHFTALSKLSEKFPVPGLWLGLDIAFMKIREIFFGRKIIKEKNEHHFDPEVLRAQGNFLLWGYWQSEKYFADNADDVRRAFRFKRELAGEAAAVAEKIRNSNSVSLHVRRGDYVKFESVKKITGGTDLSYYSRAVAYMADHVSAPHFFIFSDDSAWCRENIKIPYSVTYLDDASAGPKAAFHLQLMSLCKHNIIANSTFSWWGAWLNAHPDKIVVAPEQWNTSPKGDQADIIPEGWIRM